MKACNWERIGTWIDALNIENVLENITAYMYKIILFAGVPYFLYILFQLLRI
jgi:hypothetical protein